jgi:hypothetical protein
VSLIPRPFSGSAEKGPGRGAPERRAPASLERAFVTEALPSLADALAASLANSRFTVFQNAGEDAGTVSSPLQFAIGQIVDLTQARAGR